MASPSRRQQRFDTPIGTDVTKDRPMHVLVKFSHGLGDAVQLTCVLQHLKKYRPGWTVDVATQVGKHTAYAGLCRRSLVMGRDTIDESQSEIRNPKSILPL